MSAPAWSYGAVLLAPVALTALLVSEGWPLMPAGLAATAVQVAALGWMELRFPRTPGRPFLRDRGALQDAAHGALLLLATKALEPVVGAAVPVLGPGIWPSAWSPFAQGLLYLALVDLLEYGRHRLMHTWAWLWPIHAIHHDIDALHASRKHRFHVGEALVRAALITAPVALLGAPVALATVQVLALNMVGYPAHASVDWRLPGWLHRALVTPDVHHLHHDSRRAVHDSNYGALLPVWDVLFGTFTEPSRRSVGRYGVEGPAPPPDLAGQLLYPLTALRRAVSMLATSRSPREPPP
ncbi:MAG: sterol desaturase family protein [Alphaproteobacteria bacterium]|nr:sterol desaturase family protein [Alphaproteobacteria bacterium]